MSLKKALSFLFKKKQELDVHEEERSSMINGINELETTTVKEVMVPRVDVSFISLAASLDEIAQIIKLDGYSRYPVYNQSIDDVVGMLYVKDLVSYMLNNEDHNNFCVKEIMRAKPYFIPESKKLDDLLTEFKIRKVHIAVAIDEYGGVSGIISLEDVLEVIVGEIQDEFDDEQEPILLIEDGEYSCDARVPIDEVNEFLNIELDEDISETIGGYVFQLFGDIPKEGDSIKDSKDILFTVIQMDGHKVNRLKINIKNH